MERRSRVKYVREIDGTQLYAEAGSPQPQVRRSQTIPSRVRSLSDGPARRLDLVSVSHESGSERTYELQPSATPMTLDKPAPFKRW
jgi:hypothetical protein